MPWQETNAVEERVKFVIAVREDGMSVAAACRKFGVSRPTGYKWLGRYDEKGLDGLCDESRTPRTLPHKTPDEVVERVLEAHERLEFGPRKLRVYLLAQEVSFNVPAASTIGEILKRHGKVEPRKKRRRVPPQSEPFGDCNAPNDTWCADFKGQFQLGNKRYCYPLTITDATTRFILCCDGLTSTGGEGTQKGFEETFKRYGVPRRIRTDNGSPFASVGLGGLSRLSVWWAKLGIKHERIEPGHPEQNGRHERMHLSLKRAVTRPAEADFEAQQRAFDRFVHIFNHDRPHEGLGMDVPAAHYERSTLAFDPRPADPTYPEHDVERRVYPSGQIRFCERDVYLGAALSRQVVGLRELDHDCWLVTFADMDLGFLKPGKSKVFPIEKPGKHWRSGTTRPVRDERQV